MSKYEGFRSSLEDLYLAFGDFFYILLGKDVKRPVIRERKPAVFKHERKNKSKGLEETLLFFSLILIIFSGLNKYTGFTISKNPLIINSTGILGIILLLAVLFLFWQKGKD